MRRLLNNLIVLIAIALVGCTSEKPKYIIGVSQCSEDIWRNWQNSEMKMEANFHEGVELRFAAALDNSDRQIQQIDSLVDSGIDLLIVAPNQIKNVTPAIDHVFEQGIPVIVFERKTDSRKYTAFMSADNYEMGHQMGEYIAAQLGGKGRVIEILGLKGSSPADERHRGFVDAIDGNPGIKVAASLQGDWTEKAGYEAIMGYTGDMEGIDYVFAHNDRTAIGARKAWLERKGGSLPRFCGIDGLPGENGGIRLVRDSLLDASYIYPTRGDQLLQTAIAILEGRPYQKETRLTSAIVTKENANVLLLESDEVVRQSERLERLNLQADSYLRQLANQRIVTLMAVIMIGMLLILFVIIYRYFLQKARLADERSRLEREQLDFYTQVSHELRTPLTLIEGPLTQLAETKEMKDAGADASGLMAIVRRNTHQLTELINKMLDTGAREHEGAMMRGERREGAEVRGHEGAEARGFDSRGYGEAAQQATILIVDDNADIRAYLRNILQPSYQVNEAADGQQGLALANEIVPDLIVSDVMMPVMNGLEFCQRVKENLATSHIPVILLTARAMSSQQIEGYESGADAYITKPFSADVLIARISNLLKSRRLLKGLFGTAGEESKSKEKGNKGGQQQPLTEKEDGFVTKFREYIERNLTDSDLSVETIGAELGLSRVQLYRKVKALTGQSPVELLRTARLQKGRRLLETTDKTISEVAYEVGFTAPSYFTKCFKDEFGISPSDLS